MEEAIVLQYVPPYFYKDNHHEGPFKQNHSLSKNKSSRKNYEGPTYGCLIYPNDLLLPWIIMGSSIYSYQDSQGNTYHL